MNRSRVVGIDDRLLRKRRAYGRRLVDLECSRPIDLLPDRSGVAVTDWLRRDPGIQIVARDRSTEHAQALTARAPAALQVADRRHHLLNLRLPLERWLGRVDSRLCQLPALSSGDGRHPGDRLRAYRRSAVEITRSRDSRARRLAAHEDVRRGYLVGETLLAIGRSTGLARATVRKYAQIESFPERANQRPNPSRLDPNLAHLEQRMAGSCESAMALWREIRDQGFAGTHRQVHRHIAERWTPPRRSIAHKWLSGAGSTRAKVLRPEPLASPKQLAWTTVRTITTLPSPAAADLTRIRQDAEVVRVVDLTQRFTKLMRACGLDGDQLADPAGELGRWLLETRNCGVAALETFAANFALNRRAVQTALTTF